MSMLKLLTAITVLQLSNCLSVSSSEELTLPTPVPINFIGIDFDNNNVACLEDGTLRTYHSRLDYSEIELPESAGHFAVRRSNQKVTLANGTSFLMQKNIAMAQSLNSFKLWVLNYQTKALEWIVEMSEDIWSYEAFPLTVGGVTHSFIVFHVQRELYFQYRGHRVKLHNGLIRFAQQAHLDITNHFSGDTITVTVKSYFRRIDRFVRLRTATVTLTFNHTLNHYDYTQYSVIVVTLYRPPEQVTSFISAQRLLFSQSNSTGKSYFYDKVTDTLLSVDRFLLPSLHVNDFIYQDGFYYALTNTSLIKLDYDVENGSISIVSTTENLPQNFRITPRTPQDLIYVPGTMNVYGVQSQLKTLPQLDNFGTAKTIAVELAKYLEKGVAAPGARRILSPLFYFFCIFDDMFLYQFHDRTYNPTMSFFFDQINAIELNKWKVVDYTTVLKQTGVSLASYTAFTDYQSLYHQYPYTSFKTDSEPEGLLYNCNNFFIISFPLTVIAFICLKALFLQIFHHPASIVVRKFDFFGFLFLLLFDGNIQQFSFYMASQWLNMFAFSLSNKLLKSLIVLFCWAVVIISCCFYFVCYVFYQKTNSLLMDNNKNCLLGQALLLLQVGFRNFTLGLLNSLLRSLPYCTMLFILLTVELLFVLIFAVSIQAKVFKSKTKMWVYTQLNFLKILLLSTLFIDDQQSAIDFVQYSQQFLMMLQLLVFVIGMLVELIDIIKSSIETVLVIFCRKNSSEQPLNAVGKVFKNTRAQTNQNRTKCKRKKPSTSKYELKRRQQVHSQRKNSQMKPNSLNSKKTIPSGERSKTNQQIVKPKQFERDRKKRVHGNKGKYMYTPAQVYYGQTNALALKQVGHLALLNQLK